MIKKVVVFMLVVALAIPAAWTVGFASITDEAALRTALSEPGDGVVTVSSDISVTGVINVNGDKYIVADGDYVIRRDIGYPNGSIFNINADSALTVGGSYDLVFDGEEVSSTAPFFNVNGALYWRSGAIINCLANNAAAIKLTGAGAQCMILDGEFSNNKGTTSTSTAPIEVAAGAVLDIYGGVFYGNSGALGGVILSRGTLNLQYSNQYEGALFENNTCGTQGGMAILAESGVVNALSGVFIDNNRPESVQYYDDGDIKLTGSTLFNTGGRIVLYLNGGLRMPSGNTKVNVVEEFAGDEFGVLVTYRSGVGAGTQIVTSDTPELIRKSYGHIWFNPTDPVTQWGNNRNDIARDGRMSLGRVYVPEGSEGKSFASIAGGISYPISAGYDKIILPAGRFFGDIHVTRDYIIQGAQVNTPANTALRGENESIIMGKITVEPGVTVTFDGCYLIQSVEESESIVLIDTVNGLLPSELSVIYDGAFIRVKSPVRIYDAQLLLGIYTGDMLRDVQLHTLVAETGTSLTRTIPLRLTPNDTVRAYLWSDTDTIKPLTVSDAAERPEFSPRPTGTPRPTAPPTPPPTPTPTPTPRPDGLTKLKGKIIYEARNNGYVVNEDSPADINSLPGLGQNFPGTRAAARAFDDDFGTYCQSYENSDAAPWVGYELDEPMKVTYLRFHPRNDGWWTRIYGGRFEGAHDRDFTNPVLLYEIPRAGQPNAPIQGWNDATVTVETEFKYIRYLSRADNDSGGGLCNIAEIEFFTVRTVEEED